MGRTRKKKEVKIDMTLDDDQVVKLDESLFESAPSIKGDVMLDHEPFANPNADDKVTFKTAAGLGDVVKVVTNALNIEQCDACKERQEKLNKMFPFTKQAKSLTGADIVFLKRLKAAHAIGSAERIDLFKMYNRVMSKKLEPCNCPGIIINLVKELWQIYLANHSTDITEE